MNVKEQYWKYSLVTIIVVLGTILFVEFIPFLGGQETNVVSDRKETFAA